MTPDLVTPLEAARWLLERHPRLADLVGDVSDEPIDSFLWIEDLLTAFATYDKLEMADTNFEVMRRVGDRGARALGDLRGRLRRLPVSYLRLAALSREKVADLRLLASITGSVRVALNDFYALTDMDLLRDWRTIVDAHAEYAATVLQDEAEAAAANAASKG